jgi:tRNA (guanine-N7-)-methyltransferase
VISPSGEKSQPNEELKVRPFQSTAIEAPRGSSDFHWPQSFTEYPSLPLDLEIGCGVGWHPIQYASVHPERLLIAIEHTRIKFAGFQLRTQNHPALTNLLPVHADAIRWVSHMIKPATIDRCFILYPNPEPKSANKRWIRMPFMHRLLEALKPGGELIFATNEEWYMQEILKWAIEFWHLEIVQERSFNQKTSPFSVARTHFEKKYLQRGQTCFDVRLRKP